MHAVRRQTLPRRLRLLLHSSGTSPTIEVFSQALQWKYFHKVFVWHSIRRSHGFLGVSSSYFVFCLSRAPLGRVAVFFEVYSLVLWCTSCACTRDTFEARFQFVCVCVCCLSLSCAKILTHAGRESELTLQLREAESRCVDQARRREGAEREAAELKETCKKMRRALEGEEKVARELRWELEDRQQMAAAEVCSTLVVYVSRAVWRATYVPNPVFFLINFNFTER